MATSMFPDPMQMWRDALTKLEKEANTWGESGIKSPELMRSLQQSMAISRGVQQAFEKLVEVCLQRVNLPSRKELLAVADTLQRLEEKVDRLLPAGDAGPRPARTRQPPVAAANQLAPVPASASAAKPEPASPAPKPAPKAPARKRTARPAAKKAAARRAAKR